MSAAKRTEAEMAERIAAFEAAPAAPESWSERVTVSWQDCNCPWWTKVCGEFHTRIAHVPAYVLAEWTKADQA